MFHLSAKDTGDFRPVACMFSTSEHIPPNKVLSHLSVTFCSSSSEFCFQMENPQMETMPAGSVDGSSGQSWSSGNLRTWHAGSRYGNSALCL